MELFGNGALTLGAYIIVGLITVYIRSVPIGNDRSPQELMVFAILWPYFALRGFVRAFLVGWRELHPPCDPQNITVPGLTSFTGWLVITCLLGIAGFGLVQLFVWGLA